MSQSGLVLRKCDTKCDTNSGYDSGSFKEPQYIYIYIYTYRPMYYIYIYIGPYRIIRGVSMGANMCIHIMFESGPWNRGSVKGRYYA